MRKALVGCLTVLLLTVAQPAQAEWRPKYELLDLVNAERSPNLYLGWRLSKLARAHSIRMRDERRVFHSGYTPCAYHGENVGSVTHHPLSYLVDAFMDSPPHRANIVNPLFRRIGIGVATNRAGTVYVTLIFCR